MICDTSLPRWQRSGHWLRTHGFTQQWNSWLRNYARMDHRKWDGPRPICWSRNRKPYWMNSRRWQSFRRRKDDGRSRILSSFRNIIGELQWNYGDTLPYTLIISVSMLMRCQDCQESLYLGWRTLWRREGIVVIGYFWLTMITLFIKVGWLSLVVKTVLRCGCIVYCTIMFTWFLFQQTTRVRIAR